MKHTDAQFLEQVAEMLRACKYVDGVKIKSVDTSISPCGMRILLEDGSYRVMDVTHSTQIKNTDPHKPFPKPGPGQEWKLADDVRAAWAKAGYQVHEDALAEHKPSPDAATPKGMVNGCMQNMNGHWVPVAIFPQPRQ